MLVIHFKDECERVHLWWMIRTESLVSWRAGKGEEGGGKESNGAPGVYGIPVRA